MKHHELDQTMGDRQHESTGMKQHLAEEKMRHEEAKGHYMSHLEKHQGRHFNSQHGHDTHQYSRG